MFMGQLHAVVLTAAVLPALAVAAPLTLVQALDLAVQRAEALRAAQAGVVSAAEAARAASQLPDPVLRVGIDNLPVAGADRLSTARDAMTMKRLSLGQEWVSADQRAVRQAVADARVDRESVAVLVAAAEVRLQTALAYVEAYFASETLKLTAVAEHHAHEEWSAAQARLASSVGSSQDALAATSTRGMAEDQSAEARQQQRAALLILERWVGVPAEELLPPADLAGADEQAFVAHHPGVQMAQRDLDLARHEAALSASQRRPNWSWELSYGQRTGYADMVSFGVSLPLPVARAQRQDRETASKRALVDRAEGSLAEATRAAQAEFRGLTGDVQRWGDRILRYQASVVAPARQRTAAALAGYRSNQAALAALFEARHMEVEAQRKLLSLQRERARAQTLLAVKPIVDGGAR